VRSVSKTVQGVEVVESVKVVKVDENVDGVEIV